MNTKFNSLTASFMHLLSFVEKLTSFTFYSNKEIVSSLKSSNTFLAKKYLMWGQKKNIPNRHILFLFT